MPDENFITLKFPDGTVYYGFVSDGLPHGYGTALHADGSVYSGGWHAGTPSALGIFQLTNGTVYVGTFNRGRMQTGDKVRGAR